MENKKFTWADLKKAANELPEEFLNKEVIIWGDEVGYKLLSVEPLEEDYMAHPDESYEGSIPRSEVENHLDPEDYDIPGYKVVLQKGELIFSI